MAKKLRHVSELPDWFKITKYRDVKKLDAAGWYEQLITRKEIKDILEYRQDQIMDITTFDEKFFENTNNIGEVLKLIRDCPIVNVTSNDLLSNYFYWGKLRELKPKKPYLALGLRPITIDDLVHIISSIKPEELETYKLCQTSSYYFSHPYRERLKEPVKNISDDSTANSVAYINWDLPDELLIEHFKQYLTSSRPYKNNIHTKRYRKPDLNNWYHFGILPYLDLKIWEMENQVTIPNRVMADALFENGEGGEETVRKTTAPLADMLADEETLEILAFQASLGIIEQSK